MHFEIISVKTQLYIFHFLLQNRRYIFPKLKISKTQTSHTILGFQIRISHKKWQTQLQIVS